ncbi:unnamed protein product [Ixodes pacificus]
MADDKRGMYAMVFSPPSKQPNVAKTSTSNVEVLLLQPFARAPQLCFEDVPVGAEASRYVRVRNVLDTASMVFIERVPRDKGFAVDPEVFRLTPGTEQLVNFLWKPADDGASCRSTVIVRSDQGYKGMLVLLATVKKSTGRVRRQPQKPCASTPPNQRQAKVPAPDSKKTTQASIMARRNITIPIEFNSRTGMRQKSRVKPTITCPAAQVQETSTFADQSSQQIRQETFIVNAAGTPTCQEIVFCNTVEVADPAGTQIRREPFVSNAAAVEDPTGSTDSEEFEDSLNSAHTAPVNSGKLNDSPVVGQVSAVDEETECSAFSPACEEDSIDSSSSSNFSARMQALYEEVIKRQAPGHSPDSMESVLDKEFSIRMEERYQRALARHQSPQAHSFEAGNEDIKVRELEDAAAELDLGTIADDASSLFTTQKHGNDGELLGFDDFFPSNVSSIHGSFLKL